MPNDIQYSFERQEAKYLLSAAQYRSFLAAASSYLQPDTYGETKVCNIYYDTDDYALIRASIAKPDYKEKLRLRSYGVPGDADTVFAELKKKYQGVVYKRRISLTAASASEFLAGKIKVSNSQIANEIIWFQKVHMARPKVYLAYDRTAFVGIDTPQLRITFDTALRWRAHALFLQSGDAGETLLAPGNVLMEIKTLQACPLWLSKLLSDERIFPTSFSKYGQCYIRCIAPQRSTIYSAYTALAVPQTC